MHTTHDTEIDKHSKFGPDAARRGRPRSRSNVAANLGCRLPPFAGTLTYHMWPGIAIVLGAGQPNKTTRPSLHAGTMSRSRRSGFCETTVEGVKGNCKAGLKGTFTLPRRHRASWDAAFSYCAHRCASCERCRYVSVSIKWKDCSWYVDCL